MNQRILLLLVFLVFVLYRSTAATFIVTSNADSGTGSFREALTLAAGNGTLEKDYIHFNLPGSTRAERTITITTILPELSSNLVIDGSSQPGASIGVSDARVVILARIQAEYVGLLECFKGGDIEIYGLMFEKSGAYTTGYYAFRFTAVKGLIVGAPGKGNLFKFGIFINDLSFPQTDPANYSEDVKICANIFGLEEDGETLVNNSVNNTFINLRTIKNLIIGGDTPAEGNCINGMTSYIDYVSTSLPTGYFKFLNNRVGLNFAGTKLVANGRTGSSVGLWGSHTESAEIRNNLFGGSGYLHLTDLGCYTKVAGNKFGLDITGTKVLGTNYAAIIVGYCRGGGIIGGAAEDDKNIFAGGWAGTPLNGEIGELINIGSRGYELLNNSFYCNITPVPYSVNTQSKFVAPVVDISARSSSQINGTATPGSRVDLYYSLSCTFCQPEKLFASVLADDSGKWEYNAVLQPDNIIVASTLNGETSEFSSIRFTSQPTDVKINMVCNDAKGSITGIKFKNGKTATWYDDAGIVVGSGTDLKDMPVGKYRLVISDGYCSLATPFYEIMDSTIRADLTSVQITDAGCGQTDGLITGIQVNGDTFEWRDQAGLIRGRNLNLTNVPPGVYSLTVFNGSVCSTVLGPFTVEINNEKKVDDSQVIVANASCGHTNGSIKGLMITGTTGTVSYSWKNSSDVEVGSSKDLIDVSEGSYTLEIKDAAGCSAFSKTFEVLSLYDLKLDDAAAVIQQSACGASTGSIKGISTSGAGKFEWFNEDGTLYRTTNTADLLNVPGGNYRLRISNSGPCAKESRLFSVLQPSVVLFPEYDAVVTHPCQDRMGSIVVTYNASIMPKAMEWMDAAGTVVGNTGSLKSAAAGIYRLFLTDDNDCKSLYRTYELTSVPPLILNYSGVVIKNSSCGKSNGSVSPVTITGGLGNYSYTWVDKQGEIVGNGAGIGNIKAGTYVLVVSDENACEVSSEEFVIGDDEIMPLAPVLTDVWICAPGNAIISVANNLPGEYRLYDTETAGQVVDTNAKGIFSVNVSEEKAFYISSVDGTCESARTKVTVHVGSDELHISNTFTPNSDGINDEWKIDNLSHYPEAKIKIFNRNGNVVFENIGYATPFDGRRNGLDLPVGVYYYFIELRKNCIPVKGSLTIIR